MKLKDLLKPWLQINSDCQINDIQNDSRQVKPGNLFLAYPGSASDGRLFISQAIEAGAVAILYEAEHNPVEIKLLNSVPCIPFTGLAAQLASIASHFYADAGKSLSITGITGTNGKTSIAYQLAQAHHLLGQRTAYIGTIGQGEVTQLDLLDNTTPDALHLQKLFAEYKQKQIKQVCMEVSSHALSQCRVEGISFKQAIFTNLSLDHLDYHHTMEAYAAAKASLFATESLEWAIINQDDEYQQLMRQAVKPGVKILTYGLHTKSDIQALHWHTDITGTNMEVQTPWGLHQVKIQALGEFNIYNSLAILSSLLAWSYDINSVIKIMSQLKSAPGRMELVHKDPYVLVDFAHTPDALEQILKTLNQIKQKNLWVVFGCGGDRDKSKRPLMGKVASLHADRVIITSDNPRTEDPEEIIQEIATGVIEHQYLIQKTNRKEAIAYALSQAEKEDIIVIAGKGHEAYQQIGKIKQAFSDQKVVAELITHKSK